MAPSIAFLSTGVPVIFSLIAVIFCGLSISSREWAVRYQYADTTNITTQVDPIYTLYRSPFQICSVVTNKVKIPINANGTGPPINVDPGSTTNGGDDTNNDDEDATPPPPDSYNITYIQNCQKYRPSGLGRTSCELGTVIKNITLETLGDRRQCQQVHYAGNFVIASTVFFGLGCLCALLNMGVTSMVPTSQGRTNVTHVNRRDRLLSRVGAYLSSLMLLFLPIGVACALVSQFYGVLGLVQSAPNNGDFISSTGNAQHHDPWIQGQALGMYVTIGWGFAVLAVVAVAASWNLTLGSWSESSKSNVVVEGSQERAKLES